MPVPSTPGSNINNYPQYPVYGSRAGGVLVPVTILMGASSVPSTVSCPYAVSFASAAAGVWNFTGPSGVAIIPFESSIIPAASNASAARLRFFSVSPASGTFQVMWMQENAVGTTVSGVAPASGDRLNFNIYVHSQLDGQP